MKTYIVTLGTTEFTKGHCHKCAQLELAVTVEATDRAAAVAKVRESYCGAAIVAGAGVVLRVTGNPDHLTVRSVRCDCC